VTDRIGRLGVPVLMSLTLGLAPFVPEPHLVEKIRMIAAGGAGMRPIDGFDLLMHGAPWVWLIVVALRSPVEQAPRSDNGGG
jgi:hypothetical protein